MLLPVKTLKKFKALVDLDEMKLILRRAGSEVPMREVDAGHVAVSVVEFRSEDWKVPDGAHGHQDEEF
eukprot:6130412-Pyramimonas_sp.AAC.1